jgi:hypothetical protein
MRPSEPPPVPRLVWGALVLITVLGAAYRLAYITRPIYTDEAYTYVYFVSDGLGDILTDYREPNNHIFQTILAWVSVSLFGVHEWALRLPVFLAGAALIPATFVAGRRLYDPTAGLVAAAVVAVNLPLAEYAINARGYSFLALFYALLTAWGVALVAQPTAGKWTRYGVVAALGLYTVPVMVFPLGAAALWLLVSFWLTYPRRDATRYTVQMAVTLGLAAVATVALYMPIVISNGLAALTDNPFVQSVTVATLFADLRAFPSRFVTYTGQGVPDALIIGLLVLALVGTVAHRRVSVSRVPLLVAVAAWLAFTVIARQVVPPMRTVTFLIVVTALTAGAGVSVFVQAINALVGGHLRVPPPNDRYIAVTFGAVAFTVGVLAVLVASDAMHHTELYRREWDAEPTAAYLTAHLQDGDRVLMTNAAIHNYEYHLLLNGTPYDVLTLSMPHDAALDVATNHTLYVVNRVGDEYLSDRLRESIGVDLSDGRYRLIPLATMPNGEIEIMRLAVDD